MIDKIIIMIYNEVMDEQKKTDELFQEMPKLKEYFRYLAWKIERTTEEEKAQKLREKRERLLKTAQEMSAEDLEVVFYLSNVRRVSASKIVRILRELSALSEKTEDLEKEIK